MCDKDDQDSENSTAGTFGVLIQLAVKNKSGALLSGITGQGSFYAWHVTVMVKVKVKYMLGEILFLITLQQLWSYQLCV